MRSGYRSLVGHKYMATDLKDLKAELETHRDRAGRSEDVVTASQAGRLAGALGVENPAQNKGDPLPPGWHGVFFPGLAPLSALREDGQPDGGGPTPPVPLPHRRIIGVRATFHDSLRVGDDIVRDSGIENIQVDDYGAGATAVITVADRISTPRGLAVTEERDFLFHSPGGPGLMWDRPELPDDAEWKRTYESDPVQIFRMSAVRYNSHRIHYDRDYTLEKEGYPGLVVPVTLVSFLQMELCRAEAPDRPLAYYAYRSEKPVIDLGPYTIFGQPSGDKVTLWCTDHAGDLNVTAEAHMVPA